MFHILGVRIDEYSYRELFEKLADFLKKGGQGIVVTPNPEFIVLAQKDRKFKNILNKSLVCVPDGAGIVFAAYMLYKKKIQRITGSDMITLLSSLAQHLNYSVFLLGGQDGVAQAAQEKLQEKFPFLRICGSLDGFEIHNSEHAPQKIIRILQHTQPDILIAGLGQGKQERFLHHYLPELPSVKIAIGVGGALDYLSGRVKRAPGIFQKFGFEWLYRLIRQPQRIWRIYNAVLVFPTLIFKEKFNFHK